MFSLPDAAEFDQACLAQGLRFGYEPSRLVHAGNRADVLIRNYNSISLHSKEL